MPSKRWSSIFLMAMLCAAVMARADRDIVYSARYYNSPSSRATSHWHLYRINPDGTGKTQLTSGNTDDFRPLWSPDGRKILFVRYLPTPNENTSQADRHALCVIGADGGSVKNLLEPSISPGDSCRWSPNSRTVAAPVYEQGAPIVLLIDVATGKTERLKDAPEVA